MDGSASVGEVTPLGNGVGDLLLAASPPPRRNVAGDMTPLEDADGDLLLDLAWKMYAD